MSYHVIWLAVSLPLVPSRLSCFGPSRTVPSPIYFFMCFRRWLWPISKTDTVLVSFLDRLTRLKLRLVLGTFSTSILCLLPAVLAQIVWCLSNNHILTSLLAHFFVIPTKGSELKGSDSEPCLTSNAITMYYFLQYLGVLELIWLNLPLAIVLSSLCLT